jgi:hypothetical protein
MDILIVNINCLDHTKNLISDLLDQIDQEFTVTLVDQNSHEPGTEEYLKDVEEFDRFTVTRNPSPKPLNHTWNNFVKKAKSDIVCILNNDIRIPKNFTKDNRTILNDNPDIGAVMHPTNHPDYTKAKHETEFIVLPRDRCKQGWDICMRKSAWSLIPPQLHLFYGDDYIFENMYAWKLDAAVATSSPIIHYQGESQNNDYNIHINKDWSVDERHFHEMGYKKYLGPPSGYTILRYQDSPVNLEDMWKDE